MKKIKSVIAAAKLENGQINPCDIFRLHKFDYPNFDKPEKGWCFVEIRPYKPGKRVILKNE